MPTPEAKAAFNDAKKLSAAMRDLHAQEVAIMEMIQAVPHGPDAIKLRAELIELRGQWMARLREYQEATSRFTAAVDKSRRGG